MFPNASNFKNHDDLIVRESLGQAILGVNFGDAEIFATQFVPEVQTLPDGRLCIIRFIRQKRIGQIDMQGLLGVCVATVKSAQPPEGRLALVVQLAIEFDARRQSQFRNILAGGRAFVALVPADTQMQVTGMTEFGS
jgi:hypothetical protein